MLEQQLTWAQESELPMGRYRSNGASMTMTFPSESCPLIWESCELIAQFVSTYTGLFFETNLPENYLDRAEVEDAINYILIELIENALKFNIGGDIDIHLELYKGELRFHVCNQIWPHDMPKLEAVFQELITADPGELLVRRIEENAAQPELYRSGLGFLTIMNDYGASLGWSFDRATHPDYVRLTIMTRFPVYRSEA